jgi:acetyltransferase-like isoleucine patch superfamily enzyme
MISLVSKIVAGLSGREASGVESSLRGLWLGARCSAAKLRVGRGVEVVGLQNVRFGRGVTLWGNTYLNAIGERGRIQIGTNTHIDHYCVLYGQGGLTIGESCAIASGVIIYSQTNQYAEDPLKNIVDQPVLYAPVTVGDDVWIGARAVILPGVHVGDHAVIGAGAVVRGDVPAWAVVAGVPATVRGDRRHRRGGARQSWPGDGGAPGKS